MKVNSSESALFFLSSLKRTLFSVEDRIIDLIALITTIKLVVAPVYDT